MPFVVRAKTRLESQAQAVPAPWVPTADRRQESRCPADRRQALSAQLVWGAEVKLQDVSPHGVMFESTMRVLIGAQVTLQVRTPTHSVMLPGVVVRSRVSATRHGRLRYETALALSNECPLTNELTSAPRAAVMKDQIINAEVLRSATFVNEW